MLDRTQAELAHALGISTKTVQSYEQGWRETPVRVLTQLLLLLSIHQKQRVSEIPCWEVRQCDESIRKECPAFTLGRGQFCWFIGAKMCPSLKTPGLPPIFACMDCPVIQRLLKG